TIVGVAPVACLSARAASPSRLMPGNRITAARMRPSTDLDRVVFDDRIGEQALASLGEPPARGRVVLAIDLDVENLALAHAFKPVDGKALERALDRLALRIEHSGFQGHDDARFHRLQGSRPVRPHARSAPWSGARRAPPDRGWRAIG